MSRGFFIAREENILMKVKYKGMECELFENYISDNDGPTVRICSFSDIEKAYSLGFKCFGYPNEICKRISEEEYIILKKSQIII